MWGIFCLILSLERSSSTFFVVSACVMCTFKYEDILVGYLQVSQEREKAPGQCNSSLNLLVMIHFLRKGKFFSSMGSFMVASHLQVVLGALFVCLPPYVSRMMVILSSNNNNNARIKRLPFVVAPCVCANLAGVKFHGKSQFFAHFTCSPHDQAWACSSAGNPEKYGGSTKKVRVRLFMVCCCCRSFLFVVMDRDLSCSEISLDKVALYLKSRQLLPCQKCTKNSKILTTIYRVVLDKLWLNKITSRPAKTFRLWTHFFCSDPSLVVCYAKMRRIEFSESSNYFDYTNLLIRLDSRFFTVQQNTFV